MAKNTRNQKTGRRGESSARRIFEDLGYVCNDIPEDFGEDFFVLGEEDEVIEPFKIFVQVKASDEFDKYPSAWTEYCDPFTVRNWILSNELTIVIRHNLLSGETRYSIPEDECEYWTLDYKKDVPIRLQSIFDENVAENLIWLARIRHYDRLIKLTVPSNFEAHLFDDIPRYRLFVLEFLLRLKVLGANTVGVSSEKLEWYKKLFHALEPDFHEDAPDMTRHEQIRYASCYQVVLLALNERAGEKVGLPPTMLDHCACLLVQFILDEERSGKLPIAA